jgi:flagellar basal body-associated protein FliL
MADKKQKKGKTQDERTEPSAPRPRRHAVWLGGGLVALVATAYLLALVAVPSTGQGRSFQGPFVAPLSAGNVTVNLAGEDGKRFLVLTLNAEFDAYEEGYAQERIQLPLYQAMLTDALIRVASQKTKTQLGDAVGKEAFKEEVRAAVDPILFPIHVGNPDDPHGADPKSGLRPGASALRSTMRGPFHDHELWVSGPKRAIRLDDGANFVFQGDERDLLVEDAHGSFVHVDVTELDPDFTGTVHVGAFGRVRNLYFGQFLVQ